MLNQSDQRALGTDTAKDRAVDKARRKLGLTSLGKVTSVKVIAEKPASPQSVFNLIQEWEIEIDGKAIVVTTNSIA